MGVTSSMGEAIKREIDEATGAGTDVDDELNYTIKVELESDVDSSRGIEIIQPVEADCRIVKEEPLSENPREWKVSQTVSSIIRMDPSIEREDIQPIREHKIDGSALLQFSFHDFVTYCNGFHVEVNTLST